MKPSLRRELKGIENRSCVSCALHKNVRSVCVMGEGEYRLPVMIVGEAPGRTEDERRRPFVGLSGKLLRSELHRVGLHPQSIYMTNVVKCFPDGPPKKKEREACVPRYLKKEFATLRPRYVLTLGSPALQVCTDQTSITEARGRIHACSFAPDPLVFATYHPAYILRRDDLRGVFQRDLEDFKLLIDLDLGRLNVDSDN